MDSRQSRTVILVRKKSVEQYDQHNFDLVALSGPRGKDGEPKQSKAILLSWEEQTEIGVSEGWSG